jgi:hypothetical protein
MSKVIKKVPARTEETPVLMAECQCGHGKIIKEGDKVYEWNLNAIGSPCGCGGTYEEKHTQWVHRQPAYTLVKCDCGYKLECSGFTTTCNCGRDYNWNGEQLAPRSQWGEETNEDWWDCY